MLILYYMLLCWFYVLYKKYLTSVRIYIVKHTRARVRTLWKLNFPLFFTDFAITDNELLLPNNTRTYLQETFRRYLKGIFKMSYVRFWTLCCLGCHSLILDSFFLLYCKTWPKYFLFVNLCINPGIRILFCTATLCY